MRAQKLDIARQFRQAAWRIGREAKEIGVDLPASAKMVLAATDYDFLVAQHRRPASPTEIAKEIELMERELDELALRKLGATVLRREARQMQDRSVGNDQNPYDAVG